MDYSPTSSRASSFDSSPVQQPKVHHKPTSRENSYDDQDLQTQRLTIAADQKVGNKLDSLEIVNTTRQMAGQNERRSSSQNEHDSSKSNSFWEFTTSSRKNRTPHSPPSPGSGYIVYEITIKANDGAFVWGVHRRYNNFLELHRTLPAGVPKPLLPKKKLFGNFSDKFVEERSALLNDYLQEIFQNVVLRNSTQFLSFIAAERIIDEQNLATSKLQSYTSFPYAFRSTRGIGNFQQTRKDDAGNDCVIL